VIVRDATPADARDVVRVVRASISELCHADHGGDADVLAGWLDNKTEAKVATWLGNPANIILVAEIDGTVAGVSCLRTDGQVMLNYVAPAHRYRGVSKAMLAAIEARAKVLGLTELTLESTQTAYEFYRAAGFADSGPPVTQLGLTALPMVKRL
jgi:GNAT superfamily N-acetyltransferase